MARTRKYKQYTSKIRSQVQFTRIEGTGLKVSKTIYTKWLKGTVSDKGLAKSIARANSERLSSLYHDPAERFAALALQNQGGKEGFIAAIKASYRTQLFSMDRDLVLRESLPEIIDKSLSVEQIENLKSTLREPTLEFNGWTWNKESKRFEKETKKGVYWLTVHPSDISGDYTEDSIQWGFDSE